MTTPARARLTGFVALFAVLVTGCHSSSKPRGPSPGTGSSTTAKVTSMIPDALRQKMLTSVRAVVRETGLKPTRAFLLFQSCNDDGTAPFRAFVSSAFAGSTIDLAESQKQVDGWASTLTERGWVEGSATTGTNGRYLSHDGLTVALFAHREPQVSPSPTFTLTSDCLLGDDAKDTPEFRTGVDVLTQIS